MKPSSPPSPERSTCCDGNGCPNCNDSGLLVDQPAAVVQYWGASDAPHDGPGWYYYDSEYQDEGSVGAFETRELAVAHAQSSCYRIEADQDGAEPQKVIR